MIILKSIKKKLNMQGFLKEDSSSQDEDKQISKKKIISKIENNNSAINPEYLN